MQAQNTEAVMNNAPKFPKATAFVHKDESKEYEEWVDACEEYNELELLDSGHANAAANAAKAKMAKEAGTPEKSCSHERHECRSDDGEYWRHLNEGH